jgi:hypothetical protein
MSKSSDFLPPLAFRRGLSSLWSLYLCLRAISFRLAWLKCCFNYIFEPGVLKPSFRFGECGFSCMTLPGGRPKKAGWNSPAPLCWLGGDLPARSAKLFCILLPASGTTLQLHFVHFTLKNQPLILLFFLIFACDFIHICQLVSWNPSIKYAFIRSYFLI